ncbi:MAG: DUF72 domain-containing protein [Euryarchaeota archaeon]|nr:DUF72 domain-containing protein [Euryarchaeota archaeon]
MAPFLVGCAGWSYRDWVGPVYPPRLTPAHWLEAYADLFPFVEIDSTFYAIPAEAIVAGWLERVETLPTFRFAARLPQDITHKALPKGHRDDAVRTWNLFQERVVEPLERAKRLEAILVELPPDYAYFEKAGESDALSALTRLLEDLEPKRRNVAVEFRHASWFEHVGERLAPEVQELFASLGVCTVRVDGLGFRFHESQTAPWSYFRLHGRRETIPPSERGLSQAPYNYQYSKAEITALADPIRKAAAQDRATFVVFNNHFRGQAARNALEMMEALGLPVAKAAASLSRAAKLDEFFGA